jgi:hypothetical protein
MGDPDRAGHPVVVRQSGEIVGTGWPLVALAMSNAVVITVFLSLGIFMFGSILALIWYIGGRIDRIESHLDERINQSSEQLGGRIDHLAETVQQLREDVAVLKATR